MKQREITINLNVTHTLLVNTRRHGNYPEKHNLSWKQCFLNNRPLEKF